MAAVSADDYHHRLGLVAATMMRSSQYCEYPIACLAVWIEPAILLNQIYFFRDLGGNVVGYMTWALLAEDVERRLIHDPDVLFHFSEWNEGDRLWIMDFVLLDGKLRTMVKEAFSLFPHFTEAKSLRRQPDGTVRKVSIWRR
jgi:cytolysin-activating lysine-acyltransferase